jgi:hypothetical protein
VLQDARYLRVHRTAELLARTAEHALDEWGGDLRRLREDAGGAADGVAERVRAFPGIGGVGADIFCREVQAVWPTLRPCADDRVLSAAAALGLPRTAAGLAERLGDDDLSVLGAALVRCDRAGDADELR